MSEPTAHGSHGGCAHHHHHLPFGGGLLSRDEQRRAARQLSLAMLALGLLLLGLAWRWLAADQAGVSQILLGGASLLVALPVAARPGTACGIEPARRHRPVDRAGHARRPGPAATC